MARCVECNATCEAVPQGNEDFRLKILADLQRVGLRRGYVLQRANKVVVYCDHCVKELIGRSQPKDKKRA